MTTATMATTNRTTETAGCESELRAAVSGAQDEGDDRDVPTLGPTGRSTKAPSSYMDMQGARRSVIIAFDHL